MNSGAGENQGEENRHVAENVEEEKMAFGFAGVSMLAPVYKSGDFTRQDREVAVSDPGLVAADGCADDIRIALPAAPPVLRIAASPLAGSFDRVPRTS